MTDALWVLRPAEESDRNFILGSWINANRNTTPRALDSDVYNRGHNKLCNALLDRCACLIAAFPEDHSYILGWAVTSSSAVHYVWVRKEMRRQGIAKDLLKPYLGKDTLYTHLPVRGDIVSNGLQVPKGWRYDPYLAFELADTRRIA